MASSRYLPTLAAVTLAMLASACSTGTGPADSPLQGLNQVASADSTGATPPPPETQTATPGFVQGTVLGPSLPGAGNDSLATAPRIAGVMVRAYADPSGIGSADQLGDPVATVVTGADGRFTLPTLPGGPYVVTFTPPPGSIHGGVWVSGIIHSGSSAFPWWIVLWLR